ncbi:hypothetical protein ANO11243_006300 [Dothideomycetidae sp. 11243]|nr:hypothetical protein ANO11243_006300 [fungal sp. No.11243]
MVVFPCKRRGLRQLAGSDYGLETLRRWYLEYTHTSTRSEILYIHRHPIDHASETVSALSKMSHHSHMGHGDMDMPHMGEGQCNMNMLFTWSTKDLCIVFRSWRITGGLSLVFSLLAIVALTAGYEAVRAGARRYDAAIALRGASARPSRKSPPSLSFILLSLLRRGAFLLRYTARPEYTDDDGETTTIEHRRSLLRSGREGGPQNDRRTTIIKALFYAVQVFYSFFIMLLFMTYNGWIMLAVAAGAFVGYLMFGEGPASKTVACH